jgi:dihydroflavonol-4-reductase
MTRILVTGGSGFIGKQLVSALIARGRQVRVLDLQPPRALPQVQYVRGSVLDRDLVDRAMDGVDEVYHLAGLPGMWLPRKADFHTVNCGGTEIVIETARKRGIRRFLHCSTESILFRASPSIASLADDAFLPDDMPGPYTRSKMLADRFAMQAAASGYPVVIGCPTMPVGPHDHNVTPPAAMLRHFLGRRLQLYLDFVVNLVDVRDAAEGLILAMERGHAGHRYILGGESMPLKRVLELMADISGHRVRRIQVTGRVAEMAAATLEFIADHVTRRPPSGTAEGVRIALRAGALSTEKAQRELGYAPGPVEPVLRETIAHLLAAGHNQPKWGSTLSTRPRAFRIEAGLAVDPIAQDGPRHAARS